MASRLSTWLLASLAGIGILTVVGLQLSRTPAPSDDLSAAPYQPTFGGGWPQSDPTRVAVRVTAGVKRPGLVVLPIGSTMEDLLRQCGGPHAQADLSKVRPKEVLRDRQIVMIPLKGGPAAGGSPGGFGPPAGLTTSRFPTPGLEMGAPPSDPSDGRMNLNRATLQELRTLPFVDESLAAQIVRFRTRGGLFRKVDDLLKVPGVNPSQLKSLRRYVTI
jgi:competence protein ComEA